METALSVCLVNFARTLVGGVEGNGGLGRRDGGWDRRDWWVGLEGLVGRAGWTGGWGRRDWSVGRRAGGWGRMDWWVEAWLVGG